MSTSGDFIAPGDMIVGTCGLCGGPVTCPTNWMSVLPPAKRCSRCGAEAVESFGPVLPMRPAPARIVTTTITTVPALPESFGD